MDLQNIIVDRFGAGEPYLDKVVAAQERAEAAGLLVVLVRVAFRPGSPEISANNKTFSAAALRSDMVIGDPAVELHARLMRGNGEVVVTKKRFIASSRPRSSSARPTSSLRPTGSPTRPW
jgi:hypothetical protein